jgi:hypothetical protein
MQLHLKIKIYTAYLIPRALSAEWQWESKNSAMAGEH